MALSTPPPPPDSTPSSTTTTAAASTRPTFPPNPLHPPPHTHLNPAHHYPAAAPPFHLPHHRQHPSNLLNPRLPSNPNPNYPHHPHDLSINSAATLYPVASSGRGFLPRQPPPVTANNLNPNSHIFQARPGGVSYPRPVFGYSHQDPGQGPGSMGMGMGYLSGRSTAQSQNLGAGGGVIKGVPVSSSSSQSQHKVALSSTSVSECNGHKDLSVCRERSRDDSAVTIRDRRVRISDNASFYALCRSWLRNGIPEESQLVHVDAARSLPRPLPLPAQDSFPPLKMENAKEQVEEEESVENLTPEELLQTHIKRAKKVRSRLRGERLQRIARYRTRLALLLPPVIEQQLRNDTASGI